MWHRFGRFGLVFLTLLMLGAVKAHGNLDEENSPSEESPLHIEIDAAISDRYVGPKRALASDAEFLRRIYLDLIGTIPTSSEAKQFLDDVSAGKRARLIDQLLDDSRFNRHMAKTLDVMWMERRPDKQIKQDEWLRFLEGELADRRPLNEIARAILAADGADETTRPAVKFYLDREAEPNVITRDIGRMFFGRDLQCAQCHDHPHIDSYYQSDYYGLFAFVNRGYVFTDKEKGDFYAEKGEGEVEYSSVFTGESGNAVPRLPGGQAVADPQLSEEERYQVKPDKEVRGIPTYSRRAKLAELATRGDNRPFNENLANRLWAHMMGRGLVHPVDLLHDDNPATHPGLLKRLGEALPEMNFDLRSYLRELALSETYQRTYDLPSGLTDYLSEAHAEQVRINKVCAEVESQLEEVTQAKAKVLAEITPIADELTPLREAETTDRQQLDVLRGQFGTHERRIRELDERMQTSRAQQAAMSKVSHAVASSLTELTDKALPEDRDLLVSTQSLFVERLKTLDETLANASEERSKLEEELPPLRSQIESIEAEMAQRAVELAEWTRREQEIQIRYESVLQQETALKGNLDRSGAQLTTLRLLIAAAERTPEESAAIAQVDKTRQAYRLATANRQACLNEWQTCTTNKAEMEELLASVKNQRITDETMMAQRRSQVDAVHQALLATQQALQTLPGDEVLTQSVASLQQREAELETELLGVEAEMTQRDRQQQQLQEQMAEIGSELEALEIKCEDADVTVSRAEEELNQAQTEWNARREEIAIRESALTEQWENQFILSSLRPLSPEQLAWSTMTATGVVANTRNTVVNELQKQAEAQQAEEKNETTEAKVADASPMTPSDIDQIVQDKLAGQVNAYVSLFANAGGQPQDVFFATVEQTLYFKNGGALRSWIAAGGESVRARLLGLETPAAIAEELYLSILTRRPTLREIDDVEAFLAEREGDKDAAVQELLWGLLTSTEFRFNH